MDEPWFENSAKTKIEAVEQSPDFFIDVYKWVVTNGLENVCSIPIEQIFAALL